MDEREKKLPAWARELISELRKRLGYASESASAELATLRPRVSRLERENGALRELLECAGRGGHLNCHKINEILDGHSLTLIPND